jgi:hypothetical protein
MKKFIFSLILIACAFIANAQESATYDMNLGYSETWYKYIGVSTDVLKVGDSTWSYTVYKDSRLPLKYDTYLYLDSTGGTKNLVTVTLLAKKWLDQASWSTLKTATWTNGHDTTIVFTESSTAGQYQYYKLNILGANDTFLASIKKFYIKFWE